MLVQALFSQALEASVARFLALDPAHADLLRPLAGRVIAVELFPLTQRFYFSPTTETVLVLSDYDGEPDVVLRGSPLGFARMLLSTRPETELFQGSVEVEGNMDVARRLQDFLNRLDLDWERWLTELAGENVSGTVRGIVDWHRRTWRTFQLNLGEFLQEETRALPASLEVEDLYRRIAQLRDDTERLEARLKRVLDKVE